MKACGLLFACGLLGSVTSEGATLLSSAEQAIPTLQPVASGLFTPAQGRQGPIAQPSGQTFGAAQAITVAPTPAPAVERSEPTRTTTKRRRPEPEPAPRRKRTVQQEEEEPAPRRRAEPESRRDAEPAPKKKSHHVEEEEVEKAPAPTPDFKSGPDYKGATPMATTAKDILNVEFGWGWYNEYYFRGVNILKAVSSERTTSGVTTAHAVLAYIRPKDAFTLGFNYWQALGRQQPKGGEFNVPPNKKDPRLDGAKTGRKFSLPPRDRYAEYNFNLAYTRTLIEGQLTGTIGYNRYQFSNGTFYETGSSRAINYADESVLKLSYIGQKYFTPSISWAHDFDGFIGDFIEFRVDGNFALPSSGSITAAIRPYASLSYDMDYNGSNNGLNSLEVGADLPISLGNNLTLTFSGNYVQALEASDGERRATTGFWGGVSLSANWGGPQKEADTTYDKAAKKVVLAEAEPKPWEVSLGATYHQVGFRFHHDSVSAFPVSDLYKENRRIGDVGPRAINDLTFATPGSGRVYDNGQVGGTPTPNIVGSPGLATATFNDISQIVGAAGANGYVRFSSTINSYKNSSQKYSSGADDEDANVAPYVNLDRELIRRDSWSVRAGLGYSFLHSEGDSGYGLSRLDSLVENRLRNGFDYPLDNFSFRTGNASIGTTQLVVVDSAAYANSLAAFVSPASLAYLRTLVPLREADLTKAEVVAVASFLRTSLDLNAHDIALPISIRKDFGNRLHAELTVAPTLTIADTELKTEVSRRALRDFDPSKSLTLISQNLPNGSITPVINVGGAVVQPIPPQPTSVPPPPAPPQVTPPVAGGKGATPESPDYPGRDVGNQQHRRRSVDYLFGVKTEASLLFDLNEEKTIYAELSGGYHWVQGLTVSNGFGESNIDLSGFQVSLGLGFRF